MLCLQTEHARSKWFYLRRDHCIACPYPSTWAQRWGVVCTIRIGLHFRLYSITYKHIYTAKSQSANTNPEHISSIPEFPFHPTHSIIISHVLHEYDSMSLRKRLSLTARLAPNKCNAIENTRKLLCNVCRPLIGFDLNHYRLHFAEAEYIFVVDFCAERPTL